MNVNRIFLICYCTTLFLVFAYRFRDQMGYFRLIRTLEHPAKIFGRWTVPRLSLLGFSGAGVGFLFCLAMAVAGITTRIMLITACGLHLLYFGQIRSLAYVVRKTNLVPQILFVMALAPQSSQPLWMACPIWPIIVVKTLIAQVYVSAGYSKLRNSGLGWASAAQLQGIFLMQDMKFDIPAAASVAESGPLCRMFATTTLFHQLTFPVVLLIPSLEPIYVGAALMFHIGTKIFMRIDYLTYQGPAYLAFLAMPIAHWLLAHSTQGGMH